MEEVFRLLAIAFELIRVEYSSLTLSAAVTSVGRFDRALSL